MPEKLVWRPKRIAWLLTHAALRSAEVPVLRSLGCEVWTQKKFPDTPEYRSCRADNRWDIGLTIPARDLEILNDFDFYTDPITDRVAKIMNHQFDLVVIDGFALKTREVLSKFGGLVLMRAFGIAHPQSYSGIFFKLHTPGLANAIRSNYDRFHVGAFFEPVIPHEIPLLANRSFHLPITLPESAWARQGTWTGGDNNIFFVCPSINAHPACRSVYESFKLHFGDFSHVIAGRQPEPVDDPCVRGFMDESEYANMFRRAAMMFYHSTEPRHLHYHPLEAMATGMPVVYMRGGLLEQFDTGSQAGACATFAEAKEKASRILSGDAKLVAMIRDSQQTILRKWRPDVAREAWMGWFSRFKAGPANWPVPMDGKTAPPPEPSANLCIEYPHLDVKTTEKGLSRLGFNCKKILINIRKNMAAYSWLWDPTRPARMLRAIGRYASAVMSERTILPERLKRTRKWRRTLGLASRTNDGRHVSSSA
ncbi:MAG: hypothetical protein ACKO9Z_02880 [Planctomycetota bacterium]